MQLVKHQRSVKTMLRILIPLGVLSGCLFLLSQQVTNDLWHGLPGFFSDVPFAIWSGAILLTGLSFFAVGRYDGVAHRHLKTGVPRAQAEASGVIAIAVAQTVGFGLFTGAVARWRKLPGLGLGQSFVLSAFVSITFIVGWGFVTALACLVLPAPTWTKLPAFAVLASLPVAAYVFFQWPVLTTRWFSFELPSLRLTSAILFWSFVDMAAAGAALWLLLPENAGISILAFLPLYMLALGTALISNTPGGVGPFELVLLGALPHVPAEQLLQSIIAFRAIYYAGPACIGALALVRPFAKRSESHGLTVASTPISQAIRSESMVVEQNGGALVETPDGLLPVWPTAQTCTGMFAPVTGNVESALSFLRQSGQRMGKWPLLYKASAKDAARARRCGWTVLHIADDALLDPTEFTPDVPARRTLRRKLRAAAKAGITIHVPDALPFDELAELDADWSARLGPARGGTMGRYCPHYVQDQWVAIAYQNDRAVAFVTFFVGPQEWTLDLMRQTADAPDGTMHSLVFDAIAHARRAGIKQVSLAASPACPDPTSAAWRAIAKAVVERAGGPGLRQFKSAFAPRWAPRYAAGPGPVRLAIVLADIARAVHNPPPIVPTSSNAVHEIDEEYELASRKRA